MNEITHNLEDIVYKHSNDLLENEQEHFCAHALTPDDEYI